MLTKKESNNTVKSFSFDFPPFFIYKHTEDSWSSVVKILVGRPSQLLLFAVATVKITIKKINYNTSPFTFTIKLKQNIILFKCSKYG